MPYRTLTAVDSAIMVLDAAPKGTKRGIEEQTRKLFEVCRLRDVPILTFVNKLDREGRDPFDLLDEIEQSLALDVTPASWPIGIGRDFLGGALARSRRPGRARALPRLRGMDRHTLHRDAGAKPSAIGSAGKALRRAIDTC